MNSYHIRLTHVPGILAHANAQHCPPSSFVLVVAHRSGTLVISCVYLARGQDT